MDTMSSNTMIARVIPEITFDTPVLSAQLLERGRSELLDELSDEIIELVNDVFERVNESPYLAGALFGAEERELVSSQLITPPNGDTFSCKLTFITNITGSVDTIVEILSEMARGINLYLLNMLSDPFGDIAYKEAVGHLAEHLGLSEDKVRELHPDIESVETALDEFHLQLAQNIVDELLGDLPEREPVPTSSGRRLVARLLGR